MYQQLSREHPTPHGISSAQFRAIDDDTTVPSVFNSFFIKSVQELGNNFKCMKQSINLNVAGRVLT